MTRGPGLLALATCVMLPGTLRADEDLDRLWSQRSAPGGVERALAGLEAAVQKDSASPTAHERLVRLRFFHADRLLPEHSPERMPTWRQCVADGVLGLARHGAQGGLPIRDIEDVDRLRDRIERPAVGILFWTTLCYGNTIPGFSIFRQAAGARRFHRLLLRCLALDETYFQAGPHRTLADFLHQAPGVMGGDDDLSARHAEAAVRLFPRWAENRLCRARNVWLPRRNLEACRRDLEAALEAPDDAFPDGVPEQQAAREEARRMLSGMPSDHPR